MPDETRKAGDYVFDFELKSTDGKTYRSAQQREEGLLLVIFFKISCSTCRMTLPFVERLYERYANGKFQIWGLSQDNAGDTAGFARELGLKFPLLIDQGLALTEAYRLEKVPDLYLMGADEKILRSTHCFDASALNELAKIAADASGKEHQPVVIPSDEVPPLVYG